MAKATEAEQQLAIEEIAQKTQAAEALIREATVIADKAGISFYFSVERGMGGTYWPKLSEEESKSDENGYYNSDFQGWQSSSEDC